jgi:hypothetical protein
MYSLILQVASGAHIETEQLFQPQQTISYLLFFIYLLHDALNIYTLQLLYFMFYVCLYFVNKLWPLGFLCSSINNNRAELAVCYIRSPLD